jgi:hypothetical protein
MHRTSCSRRAITRISVRLRRFPITPPAPALCIRRFRGTTGRGIIRGPILPPVLFPGLSGSNTIYVGEARGECSAHLQNGWSYSSRWGSWTQVPINFDTCRTQAVAQSEGKDSCYANNNWNAAEGFKSNHPTGCQFVFGDGSVRFLPQNIDMTTYNYLGDKNDKKAVTAP